MTLGQFLNNTMVQAALCFIGAGVILLAAAGLGSAGRRGGRP